MMAPGGDDPQRPPTPPPKNLSLPLIGSPKKKKSRIENEHLVYIIDGDEEDQEDHHEVEIVTLDNDVFIIEEDNRNEVIFTCTTGHGNYFG
jgi:hypothetical protein